jgi:hypothetical protein
MESGKDQGKNTRSGMGMGGEALRTLKRWGHI